METLIFADLDGWLRDWLFFGKNRALLPGGVVLLVCLLVLFVWQCVQSSRALRSARLNNARKLRIHLSLLLKLFLLAVASLGAVGISFSAMHEPPMFLAAVGVVLFMALACWWESLNWPWHLDEEGMTLRSGRRLLWKDVTSMDVFYGRRGSFRWEMRTARKVAKIVPISLHEGIAVEQFVRSAIAQLRHEDANLQSGLLLQQQPKGLHVPS